VFPEEKPLRVISAGVHPQSTGWNTRLSLVCRKRGNTLSRLASGTGFNWINLRLLSTLFGEVVRSGADMGPGK
jgi:hypothetical protein